MRIAFTFLFRQSQYRLSFTVVHNDRLAIRWIYPVLSEVIQCMPLKWYNEPRSGQHGYMTIVIYRDTKKLDLLVWPFGLLIVEIWQLVDCTPQFHNYFSYLISAGLDLCLAHWILLSQLFLPPYDLFIALDQWSSGAPVCSVLSQLLQRLFAHGNWSGRIMTYH